MVLVAFTKTQAVVRSGREKENERDGVAHERGVVDVSLECAEIAELVREADPEQEAEEDGGAGDEGAELLEQLVVLPLESCLQLLGAFSPLHRHLVHVLIGSGPAHAGMPTLRRKAAA